MITQAYVRTMAAYNAEMNRRLSGAAGRLSDSERRAAKGAFWGSIHGTLVHILWGDHQWMSRFDNWPRPATPIRESDHFIEAFAELCAARDKVDFTFNALQKALAGLARRGYVEYRVAGEAAIATPFGKITRPYSGTGRWDSLR